MQVWSLGWEDPLEQEMATDSSVLAWRIPWAEGPGRLQSMGLQRIRHDLVTKQQLWKWYERNMEEHTRVPSLGIRKGFLEEGWGSQRLEGWEGADQAEQEFLVLSPGPVFSRQGHAALSAFRGYPAESPLAPSSQSKLYFNFFPEQKIHFVLAGWCVTVLTTSRIHVKYT